MKFNCLILCVSLSLLLVACKKSSSDPPLPQSFTFNNISVNGITGGLDFRNVTTRPIIVLNFDAPVKGSSASNAIILKEDGGNGIPLTISYTNNSRTVELRPASELKGFSRYSLTISTDLLSETGAKLRSPVSAVIRTTFDSTDKFPRITDDELLTLVQRQTFKYFWDFAHPVSGLARERNTSGEIVTSGGSGFGLMAIVTGIERGFITRADGLQRMQKVVDFLLTKADRFHGVFPHWLNGSTGKVVPFSQKDNGGDLVETSFLMQGLITTRQYFNGTNVEESTLRDNITRLWNEVEWDWHRQGDQNVLYWHWSPNFNWEMNHQVKGWNEALITYVLAASSTTHGIKKEVYDQGWANSGTMRNGNTYYGIRLPLGPNLGGPLFFSHYSFLGLNPNGLTDTYADYWQQNVSHSMINYQYAVDNPKDFQGYSSAVWGLTASDNNAGGYSAHSPTNDLGIISPTAAISSLPYTPEQSMNAIRFFYYKLGDKIWKEYGFVDAFNLNDAWFAGSFLAIDQGPIIIMIENHRSKLLWNLFMSAPEIKAGLRKLGFQSPQI